MASQAARAANGALLAGLAMKFASLKGGESKPVCTAFPQPRPLAIASTWGLRRRITIVPETHDQRAAVNQQAVRSGNSIRESPPAAAYKERTPITRVSHALKRRRLGRTVGLIGYVAAKSTPEIWKVTSSPFTIIKSASFDMVMLRSLPPLIVPYAVLKAIPSEIAYV